jgi:Tol biopolymer transport system component
MDGTGHRVLYRLKEDEKFHIRAWMPDGKKVLGAFKKGSESLQLVAFSIEDGSMQVIYTFDTYWPVWRSPLHKLAISPDGRYIAYDRPPEKGSWNAEIYILDIEHQRAACVVQHPAYDKLLGWTPDGNYIFFTSDRRQGLPGGFTATNTRDAYLLPVAKGRPQGAPVLIKRDIPDKIRPKGFTREGTYHYTIEFKTIETVVAKLDLQTGKLLTKPQAVGQRGADFIPAWSPDGQYLAYCTHELDQSQTIRIRNMATSEERRLDPNLPRFSWLRWSPDGKSLLVSNFAKESPRAIYRINADTGERLTMVQSESSDTLPGKPQLSLDGSTLFYVVRHSDSKKMSLVTRDTKSGHEEELFSLDGTRNIRQLTFALSPDGQQLAALATLEKKSSRGVTVRRILTMPAKGGEPRELWKSEERATMPIIEWTPDGQSLLFTKQSPEGGRELWLVPTGGGQARKLCGPQEMMCQGMMYGAVHSALDMHPDGQRIAFDCFEYRHEVWAMENFLPKAVASAEN